MEQTEVNKLAEAEQYHLKALFILHKLQANKKVYGSNSALVGADPANIELALQYIDRSLELFSENAIYLNLKALLLWEGKGQKDAAIALLEKAAILNPRDIDIQNNLRAIKSSQCIVATAAYGSPLANEVNVLRDWRDHVLAKSKLGRLFVYTYYKISPPVASFISNKAFYRRVVRLLLTPLVLFIGIVFRNKNFYR